MTSVGLALPSARQVSLRSLLLRQDDVGRVIRRGVLRALVAEADRIDAGEEVFAPAQKRGSDDEVQLVDEPGGEVLANGGNSPAEADVLAPSRLPRALQRGMN